jgi:hypothetical protein
MLKITSYKLKITSYKLKTTSYKLQITSYLITGEPDDFRVHGRVLVEGQDDLVGLRKGQAESRI